MNWTFSKAGRASASQKAPRLLRNSRGAGVKLTRHRLAICSAAVIVALIVAQALPAEESVTGPKPLPWLDSLARGYTQAQRNGRPIFVRAGTETCRFCRELDETIAIPKVQEELKRWTLVEIDADKSPDAARLLAVAVVPALRLLTPTGRLVAEAEGALSAEELVDWLQKHHDSAAVVPPDELADEGPLEATAVANLIKAFRSRDAAIREAAIRRLLPHPAVAALPVFQAFSEGSLASRLAALDLLHEWKAPLEGLDPWNAETLTAPRLKALADWAVSAEREGDSNAPAELSPDELAAAREMINRMASGPATDVTAIRERLARYGRRLLGEVYQRLKTAESDEARERLTALRYRLVESESLALNWPGGIERLAAGDPELRHRAADELAARATPADEGLLLELFSDPAALVREISLKALMQTGGSNVNSSLLRLLEDPEPNVRAAVLKQLTESPSPSLAARIATYATDEKDPDLVVHAIRVLRETGSKAATAALMSLLSHESWQVRAEAAEGLGKLAGRSSKQPEAEKVEIYVAMIDLLKDADGFVVSRAVAVLSQADLLAAVDPLAESVGLHPELTGEIIAALSHGHKTAQRALVRLKRFAGDADAKIRAAAISGLCTLSGDGLEEDLRKALGDQESDVRIAAANGFFGHLENRRRSSAHGIAAGDFVDESIAPVADEEQASPADADDDAAAPSPEPIPTGEVPPGAPVPDETGPGEAGPDETGPDEAMPTEPDEAAPDDRDPHDAWLQSIRAGKVIPKWQRTMRTELEPMLAAAGLAERVAAVLPLAALGADDVVLPQLIELTKSDPKQIARLSEVLPWLLAADRERVFDELVLRSTLADDERAIAANLAEIRSPQAGAQMWKLVSLPRSDAVTANVVKSSLLQFYFPQHYYNLEQAPPRSKKVAIAAATERAKTGGHWQRIVGLSLLLSLEAPTAAEIAQPMVDDEAASLEERTDALQIALRALPEPESVAFAVRQLSSPHRPFVEKALASLTGNDNALHTLRDGAFDLSDHSYSRVYGTTASGGQTIEPEPPPGLTAEPLLALIESPDARVAAQAGYLLALLGRPDGLPPLLAWWRAKAANDPATMRLVYRAISRLDDASQVPVVREIYSRLNNDQNKEHLSEFYWTIRGMTGPEILALRKTIRDEIGIENLR